MSGMGKVFKEGWHPKSRQGGKESWRGDFKGINQVAGWMGKGKDKESEREEHVSRPLSSLKDPSAFGPPPKHVKYHGAAALPNETTPDRRGLGAPLSRDQINHRTAQQQEQEQAEAQQEKPAPPPLPFRANRTGVDPSTLPPPPVRRMDSPVESTSLTNSKPRPSVPPRVPLRTNSTPSSRAPSPPPSYSPNPAAQQPLEGHLNQSATSRLTQAGVSVPALGIGNGGNQWRRDGNPSGTVSPSTANSAGHVPVNELQSRFAQMRTNTSSPQQAPSPPVRGNSYTNEHPSQSPVPAPDNRSATSIISDFREKHSDKIESGKQKLNGINQKYGISQRVNSFFDDKPRANQAPPPIPPHPNANQEASNASSESLTQRKAPPPPPPKKAGMRSTPVAAPSPTPPPVPMGTKPR